MSVSKTSLVNNALTLCGALPVGSITEDTNNARILNRIYEIAIKSILSECKWSFATTRASLSVTSSTVMPWYHTGETTVFARPTDVIRLFGVDPDTAIWREEGDYLISDTNPLGIEYVYYHDDPTKYPGHFLSAFTDLLCTNISYSIINSASKGDAFLLKYTKVSLPDAKSRNSQIGTQQSPLDDDWTGAKLSQGGNPARSYG